MEFPDVALMLPEAFHCPQRLLLTRQKPSFYDFRYDDEDKVLNEIEEFYSYVEMPQVAGNLKAWEGSFPGGE
jgi:hypothetical protein